MEAFAVAKARVLSGTGGIRIVREERRRRTVMMAHTKQSRERRSQNAQGEFFVDHACIDCDTCRWMAPEVFTRKDGQSAVFKQPTSEEERIKALQALLCCPTSSIHTEKPPRDILEVHKMFPRPINEQRIPGVYHCGYHAENSYGGTSYLIVHPEGNILVDSPRYVERLAQKIEMLGGARYMFLTHEDDIGDHQKWSERLRCDRIFHTKDIEASTADVEIKLDGGGPWSLGNDFELIHAPGHTEAVVDSYRTIVDFLYPMNPLAENRYTNVTGSVCLLYKPLKVLFAGDHIYKTESGFDIAEMYNQFSVSAQLESVRKLLSLDFEWILPGHGRMAEFKDMHEKDAALEAFLAEKEQASSVFV